MGQDGPPPGRAAHYLRRGYRGLMDEDLKDYLRAWVPLALLIGVFAGMGAVAFQWPPMGIWHASHDAADIP